MFGICGLCVYDMHVSVFALWVCVCLGHHVYASLGCMCVCVCLGHVYIGLWDMCVGWSMCLYLCLCDVRVSGVDVRVHFCLERVCWWEEIDGFTVR